MSLAQTLVVKCTDKIFYSTEAAEVYVKSLQKAQWKVCDSIIFISSMWNM